MRRQRWLTLIGCALAAIAVSNSPSQAQSWPDRPVKLVLPYAPGGATDAIGRPWAEKLSHEFGQQFVVENRGGASGAIGVEAVARAAPDGYTFLLTPNSAIAIVPQLRKVNYDATRDLAPVGRVGDLVGGFVVLSSTGIKSMAELIAYAKANPGKLKFGTPGLGTSVHLRIEILKLRAGVDILTIPYRGSGDALNDLLAGNIQMMNEIVVFPHVKAGKLNLLAINHTQRHWDFPDAPTLSETGIKGADVPIWYSVFAPKGTPADIIAKLNSAIVQIAKTDDLKAKMRAIGVSVPTQTPEELGQHLADDLKANLEVIKAANIKLE